MYHKKGTFICDQVHQTVLLLLAGKKISFSNRSQQPYLVHELKNIEEQLFRWLEELSQYDINIVHRPGIHHGNTNGLSRIPDNAPYCEYYEAGTDLKSLPCGE